MSRVKQKNTTVERALRQLVRTLGFRFAVNAAHLPGRPDLVNRKSRWAIFVHGCYWHAHEGCSLWKIPATNRIFWTRKFADNRTRDQRKLQELEDLGYRVMVVWQCELLNRAALTLRLLPFLERPEGLQTSLSYRLLHDLNLVARTVSSAAASATTIHEHPSAQNGNDDPGSLFDQAFLRGYRYIAAKPSGPPIRTADIFCGCGGLSLGIREACRAVGRPFLSVLAVDSNPSSLEVYKDNFSPLTSSGEDIQTLLDRDFGDPPSPRETAWLAAIGPVEILVAGPPCQGHSDLNNQTRRTDPRNKLYERIGRFAELFRPAHLLVENVPGVVHDRERSLDRTAQYIESLGYHVDTSIVDVARLGVPQKRRRHVLVASLVGPISIQDVLERHQVPERSVAWSIRDLEKTEANGPFDAATQHSAVNLSRIRYLLANDQYDLPNTLRPSCHQNDEHSYRSMYGRLSWTEPAQTVTSGFGSPGQGRFIHPSQARTLTPREAARLQFFPDSYSFAGAPTRRSLASMIGNAAPMKLSWVFGIEFIARGPQKVESH